ncbi:hypothetical protein, partial [Haloferax sp. Atlit-10N]|uniref:hypothetical protein n=1 Tax=Haloferax sp. Atlit-10N TaxID=2077204 RepID=UPI001F4263E4
FSMGAPTVFSTQPTTVMVLNTLVPEYLVKNKPRECRPFTNAAVTGPVLNIVRPDKTPECRSKQVSHPRTTTQL